MTSTQTKVMPAGFSLELTPDQRDLQGFVADFCARSLTPERILHYERSREYPWEVLMEAAQCGLYSLDFLLEAYFDPTGISMSIVAEKLFAVAPAIALALLGGTALAALTIDAQGTDEQKGLWAPRCFRNAQDEVVLGAMLVTEPEAGSDPSRCTTTAYYDGRTRKWTLNGVKTFITNGGIADINVVVAWAKIPKHRGRVLASFIVPGDTEGLSQGQKHEKVGMHASHTGEVVLENVRIPYDHVLGGMEKVIESIKRASAGGSAGGARVATTTFVKSRPTVAAMSVGIACGAFEIARAWATTREQFGRVIGMNQGIAFKLAHMATQIESARLLTWRAGWMAVHNKPGAAAAASQAKWFASEMAVEVTEMAIKILGGNGYMEEQLLGMFHMAAILTTIFEGAPEVHQIIVAREVTGLPIH